jgi:radical SAM superfamily enzyme YgiQ (UPF0313 family)
MAVGSYLQYIGYSVYIKNLEIDPNLTYQGYFNRAEGYRKYINAIDDDTHTVWQDLRNTIENIQPNKIGITVLNVKYKSALKIIKIANEYNIKVFVGGIHPTIYYKDYPSNVEVIPGEFESREKRLSNLDLLPFSNYDMLLDEYSSEGCAHIITARGCPFKCRFCASSTLWHRRVVYKSSQRILEEMRDIENKFHPQCFTIWDETFTANKKRLQEFCNGYNLSAKWRCDTRADMINENTIKIMKDANCTQISIGIESGNNQILQYIGKNETLDDYKKAAEILEKYKIQWKAYCIVGFPAETKKNMIDTLEFVKSLKPFRITLSLFTPYKGTELYDECVQLGLINHDIDLALYSHQSPYNYFCPKVPKEEFFQLRDSLAEEIDKYNKQALKVWK